ncbi:MAG: hypothetical protein ACLRZH_05905 [Ruthenibacterium lactatiformans]
MADLFQQGPDGTACIRLEENIIWCICRRSCRAIFGRAHAKTTVKARVALESTGNLSFRGRNVRCWTAKTGR